MSDNTVSTADLSGIESRLSTITTKVNHVDTNVVTVDKNVKVVNDEIGALAKQFQDYIIEEKQRWEISQATARISNIRQEIDNKFGHYKQVRKTITGILQATDLGVVRNDTIVSVTEELMLKCPDYWLAPALVALAAWINDDKEVAFKALGEALRRDDEKTSLLFGLICRRIGRLNTSLQWIKRYLDCQDPNNIGSEVVVVLDAYASGLFSLDSEKLISGKIEKWIDIVSDRSDFLDLQIDMWKQSILDYRKPIQEDFDYLPKYSNDWEKIEGTIQVSELHERLENHFSTILEQNIGTEGVKIQLDALLDTLVSEFDSEELPLRREERYCQLIIQNEGDITMAKESLDAEEDTLSEKKNFMRVLTDAVMYPELSSSNIAFQKLAFVYSKPWILSSYNDVVAESRLNVPVDVNFEIDTFSSSTKNGSEENHIIENFEKLVDSEEEDELSQYDPTNFDTFCKFGGIACGAVGIISILLGLFAGLGILLIIIGVLAVIAALGLEYKYFSRMNYLNQHKNRISSEFEEKKKSGIKVIKALLAEVVDYRHFYKKKDKNSDKVLKLLDNVSPESFISTISSSRKIK